MLEQGNRITLDSGELLRCKFTFNPTLEGTFNIKRYVEVVGWPESRAVVTATGVCDLPR